MTESLEGISAQLGTCQAIHQKSATDNSTEHARIFKRLKEMDVAMRGNGNTKGYSRRLQSLEDWAAGMKKLYWLGVACAVGLFVNILMMLITQLLQKR